MNSKKTPKINSSYSPGGPCGAGAPPPPPPPPRASICFFVPDTISSIRNSKMAVYKEQQNKIILVEINHCQGTPTKDGSENGTVQQHLQLMLKI